MHGAIDAEHNGKKHQVCRTEDGCVDSFFYIGDAGFQPESTGSTARRVLKSTMKDEWKNLGRTEKRAAACLRRVRLGSFL